MRQKLLVLLTSIAILLSSCSVKDRNMLTPSQLLIALDKEVTLPDMIDVGNEYLEALTGIGPEYYDEAVCLQLVEGTAPDEIIIIQAKNEIIAQEIQERLENRLNYKRESTELYFTEYQPMVQAGAVRLDGLVVSLIVSDQVDEIIDVLIQCSQ